MSCLKDSEYLTCVVVHISLWSRVNDIDGLRGIFKYKSSLPQYFIRAILGAT